MCNKTLRGATTKGRWKEGIQICYETLHGATTKGRWEELCKSRAWLKAVWSRTWLQPRIRCDKSHDTSARKGERVLNS